MIRHVMRYIVKHIIVHPEMQTVVRKAHRCFSFVFATTAMSSISRRSQLLRRSFVDVAVHASCEMRVLAFICGFRCQVLLLSGRVHGHGTRA